MSRQIIYFDDRGNAAEKIEHWRARALLAEEQVAGLINELHACRVGQGKFATVVLDSYEED